MLQTACMLQPGTTKALHGALVFLLYKKAKLCGKTRPLLPISYDGSICFLLTSCLRLAQPCASQAAYLGSATPGIRLSSSREHQGDLSKVPCGIFFILEVLAGSRRGLCGENPWQGSEIRWSEPPHRVRVCVEDDAEGFWV